MFVKNAEKYTLVSNVGTVNLPITLDCGQAFRWQKITNNSFEGVAFGVYTKITQIDENTLRFDNITDEIFSDIFYDYFDFSRDYDSILSTLSNDKMLKSTIEEYGTIRILRQEPWEALCSFIISACNNIPRIKGIIERLCNLFGERAYEGFYTFPHAERLAKLTNEDLAPLRAGFRVPYILSAAKMVANGEIDLDKLKSTSLEEAEKSLMQINGVGKKVADCTALFGLGHIEAFPVDRHIKRICDSCYPLGLPKFFHPYEGIAQQYMFHYQRMVGEK